MPIDGVNPTLVPLPMAYEGSLLPDGERIAYVPLPRSFQAWKRYALRRHGHSRLHC